MSESQEYPNPNEVLDIYSQIEKTAKDILLSGSATRNVLISLHYKDPRHFISVDLYLPDSPVRNFLAKATEEISKTEIGFVGNEEEHLHVSLPEVWESPEGRKEAGIRAQEVQAYYKTLRDKFPDQKPVKLRLEKITLAADPFLHKNRPNRRSISLIALFTSPDNEAYKVGQLIQQTVKMSGLGTSIPRHPGKVLYATLGRFINPPMQKDGSYPIIDTVQKFNSQIPSGRELEFDKMEMISTGIKTILSSGHVFLSPPIEFQKERRSKIEPIFLRPKSRTGENKVSSQLE